MKIGFNLLFWTPFFSEEQFGQVSMLKKIGYDGVEIPLFEGTPEHYQKMGRFLSEEGLSSTAVTVIPDENRNILSEDPKVRARGLDHLKWAIDCCQAAGSNVLAGPFYQPLGVFSGKPPSGPERAVAAEVHREAAEYAGKAGVLLAVEALNRFECYFLNTIDQAAAHVTAVNHPSFVAMFDSFHANMEEKDSAEALRRNLNWIGHVHISENDRGAPGTGQVPWDGIFRALAQGGYDGWLTIETFGRALPELAAVTRVWREFNTPEEVYEGGFAFIRKQWEKHAIRNQR